MEAGKAGRKGGDVWRPAAGRALMRPHLLTLPTAPAGTAFQIFPAHLPTRPASPAQPPAQLATFCANSCRLTCTRFLLHLLAPPASPAHYSHPICPPFLPHLHTHPAPPAHCSCPTCPLFLPHLPTLPAPSAHCSSPTARSSRQNLSAFQPSLPTRAFRLPNLPAPLAQSSRLTCPLFPPVCAAIAALRTSSQRLKLAAKRRASCEPLCGAQKASISFKLQASSQFQPHAQPQPQASTTVKCS